MGGYRETEHGEAVVIVRRKWTPREVLAPLASCAGRLSSEPGSSSRLARARPQLLSAFFKLRFPESLKWPGMGKRCPHPQVVPSPSIPLPLLNEALGDWGRVAHVSPAPSGHPCRPLGNEPGRRRHLASCGPPVSGASLGCSRRTSGARTGWGVEGAAA